MLQPTPDPISSLNMLSYVNPVLRCPRVECERMRSALVVFCADCVLTLDANEGRAVYFCCDKRGTPETKETYTVDVGSGVGSQRRRLMSER